MSDLLYLKDEPVLEIDGYVCSILDEARLPFSLRHENVSWEDVYFSWAAARVMNIGRTNAKEICAGLRISQSNPLAIGRLTRFASITDCYWIKDSDETLTWEDVNLFRNDLHRVVSSTSLLGVSNLFTWNTHMLHTPDTSLGGMSAKAVVRTNDGLFLYKVGKYEIPAHEILDTLGVRHVPYEYADENTLLSLASEKYLRAIYDKGEKIVRCPVITNEDISIVSFGDYLTYCDANKIDENDLLREDPDYHRMQVCDYILGNNDRHIDNWGFMMDNDTGELIGLHALMDHDRAFVDVADELSQTAEVRGETMKDSAIRSASKCDIDYEALLSMEKPEGISDRQWEAVVIRASHCMHTKNQTPEAPPYQG